MVQGRQRLRFTVEARQTVRVSCQGLGQDLDGDLTPEVGVRRAVHFAHSAHADLGDDFIRAEPRAGGQSHVIWDSGGFYREIALAIAGVGLRRRGSLSGNAVNWHLTVVGPPFNGLVPSARFRRPLAA